VADVVRRLTAALVPDEVVLGGGNARLLDRLPDGCRTVDNSMAFAGGFRLWADAGGAPGGAKDAAEPRRKRPAAAAARRPVTRKQA
jgi:hypothetical protein